MALSVEMARMVVRLIGDGSSYQKMLKNAQKQTAMAGRALTAGITAPLAAVGAASVREFAKFDKAMTESTSIMGNLTDETKKRMRELAMDLSSAGAQGPDELARSYFFLASAGMDAEQAMAALPQVQKFATAGAFDMARATDLLTDAQSALGMVFKNDVNKNMREMTRLSDVLVRANTLANASVEQFSIALTSKAGASLKTFNKDAEEGVAVLAAMADQGIKAELAGNNLSRIMLLLSKSAQDNSAAHKELGFKVFDAEGKMRNFADIIENLENIMKGMSDEQKAATLTMLGFQARVQGAILPIVGTSQAIRQYEAQLRQASGFTADVADKQMQAFSNQMKVLWNQIKIIGIEIAKTLVPMLVSMTAWLKSGLEWWGKLDESTKGWIVTVGVLAAAVGPLLLTLSGMIFVVSQLSAGISVLITAMTTLKVATVGGVLAAAAMKAAFLGLAIGGIALLARQIYLANPAIKAFNDELARGKQLADQLAGREARQRGMIFQEAAGMTGKARIDFLKEQIAKAKKEALGLESHVKRGEKQVEKYGTTFRRTVGNKVLKGMEQQVAEDRAALKSTQDFIGQLNDELRLAEKLKGSDATNQLIKGTGNARQGEFIKAALMSGNVGGGSPGEKTINAILKQMEANRMEAMGGLDESAPKPVVKVKQSKVGGGGSKNEFMKRIADGIDKLVALEERGAGVKIELEPANLEGGE